MATSQMTMKVHNVLPDVQGWVNQEPAALMLDQEGKIRECNATAEMLFGFHHDELITRPIAQLLPQLRDIEWFQNGTLNPRLSYFCHIGRHFHAVRRDGSLFASRLFFHDLDYGKTHYLRLIVRNADSVA